MSKWQEALQKLKAAYDIQQGHYTNLKKQRFFVDSKNGGRDIYSTPTFPYNIFQIGTIDNIFIDDSKREGRGMAGPNVPNSNTPINQSNGTVSLIPGYRPGGYGFFPAMFANDIYPHYANAGSSLHANDLSSNGTGSISQISYAMSGAWPTGITGAFLNNGSNSVPYSDGTTAAGDGHMPEIGQTVVYVMLPGGIPYVIGNINDTFRNQSAYDPDKVLGANVRGSNQKNTELQEGARTEQSIRSDKKKPDIRNGNENIARSTGSHLNASEVKVNDNTCMITVKMDGSDEFIELAIQSGPDQHTSKFRMDGDTIYSYTHAYTIEAEDTIEMLAGSRRSHVYMDKSKVMVEMKKSLINMTEKTITFKSDLMDHVAFKAITMDGKNMIWQHGGKIIQNPPGAVSPPDDREPVGQQKEEVAQQRETQEAIQDEQAHIREEQKDIKETLQGIAITIRETILRVTNEIQYEVHKITKGITAITRTISALSKHIAEGAAKSGRGTGFSVNELSVNEYKLPDLLTKSSILKTNKNQLFQKFINDINHTIHINDNTTINTEADEKLDIFTFKTSEFNNITLSAGLQKANDLHDQTQIYIAELNNEILTGLNEANESIKNMVHIEISGIIGNCFQTAINEQYTNFSQIIYDCSNQLSKFIDQGNNLSTKIKSINNQVNLLKNPNLIKSTILTDFDTVNIDANIYSLSLNSNEENNKEIHTNGYYTNDQELIQEICINLKKFIYSLYNYINNSIPTIIQYFNSYQTNLNNSIIIIQYIMNVFDDIINQTNYITSKQIENDIGQLKINSILEKEKIRDLYADDPATMNQKLTEINTELVNSLTLYTYLLKLIRNYEKIMNTEFDEPMELINVDDGTNEETSEEIEDDNDDNEEEIEKDSEEAVKNYIEKYITNIDGIGITLDDIYS